MEMGNFNSDQRFRTWDQLSKRLCCGTPLVQKYQSTNLLSNFWGETGYWVYNRNENSTDFHIWQYINNNLWVFELFGHRFTEKLFIKIIPSHFSLAVRLSHKIDQVSWVLNVCNFLVFISSALPFRHCITENVNCLLSIHDEISFGLNISL